MRKAPLWLKGYTGRVMRDIRRQLVRRSAIEQMIGHMKTDGCVARCALMGTLGDALHAVLCGCGHNIRMILAHLNACWAEILAVLLVTLGARGGTDRSEYGLKARGA